MKTFYFSEQQSKVCHRQRLPITQVWIDGTLCQYTQQCDGAYTSLWKDVVCLGQAKPTDVVIGGIRQNNSGGSQ